MNLLTLKIALSKLNVVLYINNMAFSKIKVTHFFVAPFKIIYNLTSYNKQKYFLEHLF